MRSSSEAALQRIGEMWSGLVAVHPSKEILWARVLFDCAEVISRSPSLLGALEDLSRSADARAQLVRNVFGGKVDETVLDLLIGFVRESWSQEGDLVQAIELIGIDTVLLGAQREELLSKTEEELYQSMRVLKEQRQLRLILNDTYYARGERSKLVEQVFAYVNPYTRFLISHAVRRTEHYSIAASLDLYIERCAIYAKHLAAAVTSAIPLTVEQESRLVRILQAHYGHEVRIHTTIDPAVIGGVRIHIQDDIIDGTLSTRLAAVKDSLKK